MSYQIHSSWEFYTSKNTLYITIIFIKFQKFVFLGKFAILFYSDFVSGMRL